MNLPIKCVHCVLGQESNIKIEPFQKKRKVITEVICTNVVIVRLPSFQLKSFSFTWKIMCPKNMCALYVVKDTVISTSSMSTPGKNMVKDSMLDTHVTGMDVITVLSINRRYILTSWNDIMVLSGNTDKKMLTRK